MKMNGKVNETEKELSLFYQTQVHAKEHPKNLEKKTNKNDRSSDLKFAVQHDIIIRMPQHADSRRICPTTQLNTPNSHTRGTPKSRRCSWSNLLPWECPRICVLVMVGSRKLLDY